MPVEIRLVDLIDIAIVATAIYYILLWLKGTRAMQLVRGLFILLSVYVLGKILGLHTINWLFERFIAVIIIMLIIVFQPELRRALERIGRGRLLSRLGIVPAPRSTLFVQQIVRAVFMLSESNTGGLIVIERNTGLSDFFESGIILDSLISADLLTSIFSPKNMLHDGAVIISGERIAAARCLLPLSESTLLDKRLGTRHRAAVGLSEQSDAFVIVVSERSGIISIAENGLITRNIKKEMLEERLFDIYKVEPMRFDLSKFMLKKAPAEPEKK